MFAAKVFRRPADITTMKQTPLPIVLDGTTIADESYYNLCVIADQTHYPHPVGAIRSTGEKVAVKRDECGNILTAILLPASLFRC
jgi:hypothetical protein